MCGTCPARWLSFKSHYELVIRANIANNVENLRDQQYRAVQLRLQISGEPECWLNQAEQSGEAWVASGDAIIERFDKCFVTADGIEMAIRHFEGAHQEVSEDLGAFMSRLRRLAGYAFAMEGEDYRRSRVIWKFVTGLHDECVRRDVIRHKWISEESLAKEYDVIVSTAQDALRVIRAKEISGPSVSTVKEDVQMAAVQDLSKSVDRVLHLVSENDRRTRPQQRGRGTGNRRQSQRTLQCWYCCGSTLAAIAIVVNARRSSRPGNPHEDKLRRRRFK